MFNPSQMRHTLGLVYMYVHTYIHNRDVIWYIINIAPLTVTISSGMTRLGGGVKAPSSPEFSLSIRTLDIGGAGGGLGELSVRDERNYKLTNILIK